MTKISKDEALDRARDRLTTLGLPARVLDAYPHQLSMKQRTVTIISTLLNPRLLVADEPTSALDVTSQKILIEMLLEMLEKRIMSGVIFVTHDLPVLRTAANRIAVMYQGRIIELGPTEIVVERPEHPYTQALMSSVLAPEPAYANTRIEGMSSFRPFPLRRTGGDSLMTEIYRAEHITRPSATARTKCGRSGCLVQPRTTEVTTIVGESGSGKSTIARMVLGLMPITSGKLFRWQGRH